jgi:hypothetical protein
LYSAYVRACALLDSSSPITSIRMGSIGSSGRAASVLLRCSLALRTPRSLQRRQGRGRTRRGAFERQNRWLRADGFLGCRLGAFRTETHGFRMKSASSCWEKNETTRRARTASSCAKA